MSDQDSHLNRLVGRIEADVNELNKYMNNNRVDNARFEGSIEALEKGVQMITENLKGYVTQDQFAPISKTNWAIALTLLAGVIGAILKAILK